MRHPSGLENANPPRAAYPRTESLVRRSDGRGYFVQSPTVSDIIQAVQVRGHLESLAIRLMAQSPDRHKHLQQMADAIDTIEVTDQPRAVG